MAGSGQDEIGNELRVALHYFVSAMHHERASAAQPPWIDLRTIQAEANDIRHMLHWHGLCISGGTMHGALNTCGRWFCLIGLLLCLSACAPILTLVGYSQPAIQIAAQLDRIKFLGDGVSYVGSGKTISDHALSKVAGADCTIFNIAKREPVCASPGAESVATVAPARPRAEAEEPPRPAALETDTQEVATARNFPAEGE